MKTLPAKLTTHYLTCLNDHLRVTESFIKELKKSKFDANKNDVKRFERLQAKVTSLKEDLDSLTYRAKSVSMKATRFNDP